MAYLQRGERTWEGARAAGIEVSTIKVKNVPLDYTMERFLSEVQRLTMGKSYNFVLMPTDPHTGVFLGYCIMNFVSSKAAFAHRCAFYGHRWVGDPTAKPAFTCPSMVQGMSANLLYFLSCGPAVSASREPLILDRQGRRVEVLEAVRTYCSEQQFEEAHVAHFTGASSSSQQPGLSSTQKEAKVEPTSEGNQPGCGKPCSGSPRPGIPSSGGFAASSQLQGDTTVWQPSQVVDIGSGTGSEPHPCCVPLPSFLPGCPQQGLRC